MLFAAFILGAVSGVYGQKNYPKIKKSIYRLEAQWNLFTNTRLDCPFSVASEDFAGGGGGKRLIAHAGGGIEGYSYTNSKEALEKAIANGFQFIELDLLLSAEGKIYAAHGEKEFNQITGFPHWGEKKPNLAEIKTRKIYEKFTTLNIDEINAIFQQNPNLILVTDKLQNWDALTAQIPYLDRVIVEAWSWKDYKKAVKQGIPYPALSTEDFDFAFAKKIPLVVTHTPRLNHPFVETYIERGGCVLAYSTNDENFMRENNKRATLFYTDFYNPRTQQCEAKECKTY